MHRLLPLSICLLACAHPPPARPDPQVVAVIDQLATDMLAKTPAAGISITVVHHGQTIVERGYGNADADAKTPVTPATLFRIGSITKQFTAAAILQLAAAGKLTLDDDVHRTLPDYPSPPITLRQLLAHTSGIHDYERGAWLAAHMAEHRPRAELVASFAAEPLDFTPGAKWSYSNSGYYLLGLVIERVTGKPWATAIDELLAHARLDGIRNCPDEQTYPDAARGYDVDNGHRVPTRPIAMEHAYAAGGLCATAPALVAWMRALAAGRIVDAASWRAMTTPVTLPGGDHFQYGLGLFTGELAHHRAIFHGGGVNGFVSTLAYYPDDDLTIAVLVNTDGSFADELGEAIARAMLGLPRAEREEVTVPPEEAAAVAGRYEANALGLTLVVEVQNGVLVGHREGGEPRPLQRQRDGSYLVNNGRLTFTRDHGRVTGLTFVQGGMTFEAVRVP